MLDVVAVVIGVLLALIGPPIVRFLTGKRTVAVTSDTRPNLRTHHPRAKRTPQGETGPSPGRASTSTSRRAALTSPRADAHNSSLDASHRSTASRRPRAARRPDGALRARRAHPGRVAPDPPLLRPLLPARPHEPHATHQDPGRDAHGRADGRHGRGRGPVRARHRPRDDAPGHPDPLGPDRRHHRPLRAAPRGRHHDARRVRRQRAQRDRVPVRGHGAQRALRRLALLHRAPRVLPLQPAQPDPATRARRPASPSTSRPTASRSTSTSSSTRST